MRRGGKREVILRGGSLYGEGCGRRWLIRKYNIRGYKSSDISGGRVV